MREKASSQSLSEGALGRKNGRSQTEERTFHDKLAVLPEFVPKYGEYLQPLLSPLLTAI